MDCMGGNAAADFRIASGLAADWDKFSGNRLSHQRLPCPSLRATHSSKADPGRTGSRKQLSGHNTAPEHPYRGGLLLSTSLPKQNPPAALGLLRCCRSTQHVCCGREFSTVLTIVALSSAAHPANLALRHHQGPPSRCLIEFTMASVWSSNPLLLSTSACQCPRRSASEDGDAWCSYRSTSTIEYQHLCRGPYLYVDHCGSSHSYPGIPWSHDDGMAGVLATGPATPADGPTRDIAQVSQVTSVRPEWFVW